MSETSSVTVVFSDSPKYIVTDELAQFLASFSAVYDGAAKSLLGVSAASVLADPREYFPEVISYFYSQEALRDQVTTERSLRIERISYASPLEIVFYGLTGALIVALVLAGGEIRIFGAKVKIEKSLGESLRDLRSALRTPLAPKALPQKEESLGIPSDLSELRQLEKVSRPATGTKARRKKKSLGDA